MVRLFKFREGDLHQPIMLFDQKIDKSHQDA